MQRLYFSIKGLGRAFLALWFGLTLSMLGTSLLEFAVGVWVYQQSGSVMGFSAAILSAVLPSVLVMPLAGSAADRFERRYLIVFADLLSAAVTFGLAILLWRGEVAVWNLYVFVAVVAVTNAVRLPAYRASVRDLVSKEKFVRANGMMEMSSRITAMLSPLIAGAMMAVTDLLGVVIINLIAFSMGAIVVFRALAPASSDANQVSAPVAQAEAGDSETSLGAIGFFRSERLMLALLFYVIIQGGLSAFASTMVMPLVLASHSTEQLGLILSCGSMGGLAGAAALVVFDRSRHLMLTILICDVLLGLCIAGLGVFSVVAGYCIAAFAAIFVGSFAEGCADALWMRKAPQRCQGSIFSLIGTLYLATSAIVILGGGVLADRVFEPALTEGGMWSASSLGVWFGTQKGSGLALMFVICGICGSVVSLAALAQRRLRQLDTIVPDGDGSREPKVMTGDEACAA